MGSYCQFMLIIKYFMVLRTFGFRISLTFSGFPVKFLWISLTILVDERVHETSWLDLGNFLRVIYNFEGDKTILINNIISSNWYYNTRYAMVMMTNMNVATTKGEE